MRKSFFLAITVALAVGMMPVLAWSAITIEKSTNGDDADTAPGPSVLVGDPVTWEYIVTSDEAVSNVAVTDDVLGGIAGPSSGDDVNVGILDVGETWIYTVVGVAVFGQYENKATVTGDGAGGVTDDDYSHYLGVYEACSKGFWRHHLDEWTDPYDPDDLISVFFADLTGNGSDTLLDALNYTGKGGKPDPLKRGAQRLLRQAVAALLNAAAGFDTPPPLYNTPGFVTGIVSAALNSGNAQIMYDLAEILDDFNSGICPLEDEEEPEEAPGEPKTLSTLWGAIKSK